MLLFRETASVCWHPVQGEAMQSPLAGKTERGAGLAVDNGKVSVWTYGTIDKEPLE